MSNQLIFHVFYIVLHHGIGVVNFALHKSAVQSTTLYYNNFNWTADKAVDGNSSGSNPETSRTCSATNRSTSFENHIWEVDIGVQIIVKTITVYGRTDKANDQLDGVKLYLGNTSGPWNYSQEFRSDPSNENIEYVFKPTNAIARFISLMRAGTILVICEVTVEGECRRGTYGSGCNGTCGNCYKGNISCSLTDGRCTEGCEAGWHGDICKLKCEAGTYGFNCSETCGYCLNGNNSCSEMNGLCIGGCQAEWKGETCKLACKSGTYGSGCNGTCGNCYKGNISCSLTDGRCKEGCEAGWHGDICKLKCKAGTYGFNCNETCGVCLNGKNNCSERNGQCSGGCQAGWTGEKCKSACLSGTYGSECNGTCGDCYKGNISCSLTDGRCTEGCAAGWHGDICNLSTPGTVNPVDVGTNTGVIVGSVLAAVGVSLFVMVSIIVVVKHRGKMNKKETNTENVTTATQYANLVVGNPDTAYRITVRSTAEKTTSFSAIEETSLPRGMPIGAMDNYSGVKESDVPVHNDYEKLRDVTESTESAYSTIDHSPIDDQRRDHLERCGNFVQILQSL